MTGSGYLRLCILGLSVSLAAALPLYSQRAPNSALVRKRGTVLPISRSVRPARGLQVRANGVGDGDEDTGAIGLGNIADFVYTVSVDLGTYSAPFHLDTGSSDLWAASDTCTTGTCVGANVTLYPMASFTPTGGDVRLTYGDSTSGTFALGPVGQADATLAGLKITGQPFAAMNATNNTVLSHAAGIFGLGFPSASQVQAAVVKAKSGGLTLDDFVNTISTAGPLLSRLAMAKEIDQPMFAVTLQRDTIDVGGNEGSLTIGELPAGVDNSTITWAPVRLYGSSEGGLGAPSFAPSEVYPLRWEVIIDAVYFDGQKLPNPASSGGAPVSALIDTGNSILRGPTDVVSQIYSTISPSTTPSSTSPPTFPCAAPHTLTFQIGGKMFPVDPRDFVASSAKGGADTCDASKLVATDPPNNTGQLFSWSLGDPFLKSNVVVFYYGNLTHPSVDPPRIGFLSTVPADSNNLLKGAVDDAKANGDVFESTIEAAPTSELPDGAVVVPSLTSAIPATATPSLASSTSSSPASSTSLDIAALISSAPAPLPTISATASVSAPPSLPSNSAASRSHARSICAALLAPAILLLWS